MRVGVGMTGLLRDARYWQILSLSLLLGYGLAVLGFDQRPASVALIIVAALATQWVGARANAIPFDPLSPLITSLSLSLLLRADHSALLVLAGVLAVGSKFVLRIGGKHVFNPANFAIVVLMLTTGRVWISPSQWGSAATLAFLFACLAGLVLTRANRADIALAFLAAYAAILAARALWLGDPMAIPMKQMQSGALLLFAFFMISDPKTTPDRRSGRLLYAAFVAALGALLQFGFWRPEGMMLALFFASPLVPLIDRWRPIATAERFQWSRPIA